MSRHPARYTDSLLPIMAEAVSGCKRILDPFAGTGKIFGIRDLMDDPPFITGVELEHEWASQQKGIVQANSLHLPFPSNSFDAIVTSPTYGNRLADHHNARDGSVRRSYTHDLGRPLHADNSGTLHWGPAYRSFHEAAWIEATRVLLPNSLFVINIKNHIRNGVEQPVAEWHLAYMVYVLGYFLEELIKAKTPSMRYGANANARVDHELVLILRKP